MKNLVEEVITCDLNKIKNCKFPINKKIGLIVPINNVKYEFILSIKDSSDKLLDFAPSARDASQSNEDKKKPIFHRWSWKYNQSTIHFNDPTTYLNNELLGGWGLGTEKDWYLPHIADIITEIIKNLNIKRENLIFYGSSLGGFISIMLSIILKDTKSIAEIPQFDVTKWGYHWPVLKKHCFNGKTEEYIKNKFGYRIDCIEMMKKENYIPDAFIIIDCSHDYDYNNVYLPFFNRLNELPYGNGKNNIKLRVDGKNKGHMYLDYSGSVKLVNQIIRLDQKESQEKISGEQSIIKELVKQNNELQTTINKLKKINKEIMEEQKVK